MNKKIEEKTISNITIMALLAMGCVIFLLLFGEAVWPYFMKIVNFLSEHPPTAVY